MRVRLPSRPIIVIGLIAPGRPTLSGPTGEQFEERSRATRLNDRVLLVWFA